VEQWQRVAPHQNGCGSEGAGVAFDGDGNVIVVGKSCFVSTAARMGLVKYNPAGDVLWSAETGSVTGSARAAGVVVDPDDEIFVVGYTTSPGSILTARFSPQGELRWIVPYGTGTAVGIGFDPAGYLYVAGSNRPPGQTDQNYVLLRYDLDGNLRWRGT